MTSLLLLASVLLHSPAAQARGLDLIYKNNEGARHFKKEKYLEAYETFLGLTAEAPYDPLLQFNLGAALAANKEEAKAAPLYKQLLKTLDEKLKNTKTPEEQQDLLRIKFGVLYNLGVYHQGVKEPEEALKYYQQALELLPDSKEIKTNIEMMFSGGGNGKGQGDPQKNQQGEGEGQGDPQQDQQGQKPEDKQDQKNNKPDKKKEFDQNQMSKEDLERIMDELKQQEQNIRAKVNKKGGKSEQKEKEW